MLQILIGACTQILSTSRSIDWDLYSTKGTLCQLFAHVGYKWVISRCNMLEA